MVQCFLQSMSNAALGAYAGMLVMLMLMQCTSALSVHVVAVSGSVSTVLRVVVFCWGCPSEYEFVFIFCFFGS